MVQQEILQNFDILIFKMNERILPISEITELPTEAREENSKKRIQSAGEFITSDFIGLGEERERKWAETEQFVNEATPKEFSDLCLYYFNFQCGPGIRLYEGDREKRVGPLRYLLIEPVLSNPQKREVLLDSFFEFIPSDLEFSSRIFLEIGDCFREDDKNAYLNLCERLIQAGEEKKVSAFFVFNTLTQVLQGEERSWGLSGGNLLRIGLWDDELARRLAELVSAKVSEKDYQEAETLRIGNAFYLAWQVAKFAGALGPDEFSSYFDKTLVNALGMPNVESFKAEDFDFTLSEVFRTAIHSAELSFTFSKLENFQESLQLSAGKIHALVDSHLKHKEEIEFCKLDEVLNELNTHLEYCRGAKLENLEIKASGAEGKIQERGLSQYLDLLALGKSELENHIIVDIGAGKGHFAKEAQERVAGAQVISIEPYPEIRKEPKGSRVQALGETLPLAPDSADEIVSVYALPYYSRRFEDVKQLLDNVVRVLKRGGEARLVPFLPFHVQPGNKNDFYNWKAFEQFLEQTGITAKVEIGEDIGGCLSYGSEAVRCFVVKK